MKDKRWKRQLWSHRQTAPGARQRESLALPGCNWLASLLLHGVGRRDGAAVTQQRKAANGTVRWQFALVVPLPHRGSCKNLSARWLSRDVGQHKGCGSHSRCAVDKTMDFPTRGEGWSKARTQLLPIVQAAQWHSVRPHTQVARKSRPRRTHDKLQ